MHCEPIVISEWLLKEVPCIVNTVIFYLASNEGTTGSPIAYNIPKDTSAEAGQWPFLPQPLIVVSVGPVNPERF